MRRLRTLSAPLAVARRSLQSDLPLAGALFAAVAATAFLFALAPQVVDRLAETSLEQQAERAEPLERDLAITAAGRIDPAAGPDPAAGVRAFGERHAARLPAAVQAVAGEPSSSLETVRYELVVPPGERAPAGTIRYVTLRHLDGADASVEAAEGDLPSDGAGPVELPFGERTAVTGLEVALSAATARQLSVGLGDLLYAQPAGDDTLVRAVPVSERRLLALHVVGIVAARPGRDAWLAEARLARARIRDTETARYVYAYALVAGEAYNELAAGVDPLPLRYEWRLRVDPAAVGASDTDALAAGVREVEAVLGETTFGQRLGVGVRTGLGRILERHEDDRRAAEGVLAVAGIALLGVALTVLGVLAALAAERREAAIELLRSRGGSVAQTLAAQALEGLLVALPAGALGWGAAALAAGRGLALLPIAVVATVVVATVALLVALAAGPARRALVARRDDVPAPPSPARLAVEGLVAVAALVGAYLLRRRGLDSAGDFDPFLAAVPVLAGLAAGLLALRLYPLPLRALAWAAAPRRDLVPALGLRRLAREPSLSAAPLLVVLLATAVGVFAATLAATIGAAQDGQNAAALTTLDTGTLDVFRIGVAVAAAYAALALALAPVLTARDRVRSFAYLRALGLARRDVVGLAAFELAPPVAAALVVGLVLGGVLAVLVEPALDLGALAGGSPAPLRPAFLGPALLVAAIVLVTALVTLLTAAAARRVSLGRVLRTGER